MTIDPKFKILILGHGRHGKDTFAALLAELLDIELIASSLFCAEHVVFPVMEHCEAQYFYRHWSECYDDRSNHRPLWHEIIKDYNTPDKAKLAKEITAVSSGYIGMRCEHEYAASMKEDLFDVVIWVDAKERLPLESPTSFTIAFDPETMLYVNNNGDEKNLEREVLHMSRQLKILSHSIYPEVKKYERRTVKPVYAMPDLDLETGSHMPLQLEAEKRYLLEERQAGVNATTQTQFEKWGAFELPIVTIRGFLDSDAQDRAAIQVTKGELKDFMGDVIEATRRGRKWGDDR